MVFKANIALGAADINLRETYGYKFEKKLYLLQEEIAYLNKTCPIDDYEICNFYSIMRENYFLIRSLNQPKNGDYVIFHKFAQK